MKNTLELNRILIIAVLCLMGLHHSFAQEKERDSILKVAEQYRDFSGTKELNKIVLNAQEGLKVETPQDSLYAAKLFLLEAESIFYTWNVPLVRKKFNEAINMSPNNYKGQVIKAEALLSSTSMEAPRGFEMIAYTKTKEALYLLNDLKSEAPSNLLLMAYENLMILNSTFGDTQKQKEYRNKAKKLFDKNSFNIEDYLNFQTANMMSLYQTDVKESSIVYYFDKIKTIPNKNDTSKYKYIYASALNRMIEYYYHVYQRGDHNALKKGNSLISETLTKYNKDSDMAHFVKVAMYFKSQFLINENRLQEALKINTELISISFKKDRRLQYSLSQRLILLLKLNKTDESKKLVFNILEEFHNQEEELKDDYSNFSAANKIDYTTIFLDISDAFYQHKKDDDDDDDDVKKFVNTFNNISLNQFKKSIDNKLTTQKIKDLFKRITSNLLLAQVDQKDQKHYTSHLLETIENVENTIEWQEFLQQRSFSKSKNVNEFKFDQYAITSELIKARQKKEDSTISKLELQLEQLERDFKSNYPTLTKYNFSEFNTIDFQKSLLENEVVLRYETINDSLYTFAISRNDIKLIKLGSSKSILKLTKNYVDDIKKRNDASQKARELYSLLIPKVTEKFTHLNIMPDDYLYKLPFETLMDYDNNYLIENKTVLYAPYLGLLKFEIQQDSLSQKEEKRLLIFTPAYDKEIATNEEIVVRGNEYRLNGAKKESKLISGLFPNTSFSDFSATKENFKLHAPDGRLLHLSMHASLNATTPELSHLIFTEGNTDNKLYLEELYGMNLNADMAVLSACNTGVGEFEIDRGVVSLHRAFTQAGVPTTVSSLWDAPDDATQKIMVEFYKQLKSGKSKSTALQLAKINYLKSTESAQLQAPYYWAGFVINGNNNPIIMENSFSLFSYWWVIIIVIILILLTVLYLRNQSKSS